MTRSTARVGPRDQDFRTEQLQEVVVLGRQVDGALWSLARPVMIPRCFSGESRCFERLAELVPFQSGVLRQAGLLCFRQCMQSGGQGTDGLLDAFVGRAPI